MDVFSHRAFEVFAQRLFCLEEAGSEQFTNAIVEVLFATPNLKAVRRALLPSNRHFDYRSEKQAESFFVGHPANSSFDSVSVDGLPGQSQSWAEAQSGSGGWGG